MLIMPAAVLGGIVAVVAIFFLGYIITHILLDRLAQRRNTLPAYLPPLLTGQGIDRFSIAGGLLLTGLAVLLLFTAPGEWAVGVWIVLTLLGFLAALASFTRWGKYTDAAYNAKSAQAQAEATIIIACVNCAQKLRVPRRRQKIIVTCPKCRVSFPYGAQDPLVEKLKKIYQSLLGRIRSI